MEVLGFLSLTLNTLEGLIANNLNKAKLLA